MERLVQRVTLGGLSMLSGLWVAEFARPRSLPWLAGTGLALVGVIVLLWGIYVELDVDWAP